MTVVPGENSPSWWTQELEDKFQEQRRAPVTPQEIERNAPIWTVQMLIAQLQCLSEESKQLPLAVHSSEYGDEPYYGVLKIHDGIASITPDWSPEMVVELQKFRKSEEAQRAFQSWNRPEVQEAKRQGLLPLWRSECRKLTKC